MSWCLGLDMSLRSPGLAICDPTGKWTVGCFAQTKRRVPSTSPAVKIYPAIPSNLTDDILRYIHIRKYVRVFVEEVVPVSEISSVRAVLEGYAFQPTKSGSSYKLHELGGCIKMILSEMEITKVYIVPPSKWKKDLGLSVRGNKWAAFDLAKTLLIDIDMFCATNVPMIRTKDVPNPVQDMADAICLVQWLIKRT